ncbi:MAG: curli assembly protein CsgF [Pseudomonadota bacterium]|nr:curli assembly protein CsgF [Pseudomonadota bacterium]
MQSEKQFTGRRGSSARTRTAALVCLLLSSVALAGEAQAQELTHRFLNPSFGGNPFYSDHLLSIATIHRPREPERPGAEPPTEEELIASQVRARLLSGLSSDILTRIESAQPGESGDFEFGDQRISFTRTRTETVVTFVNSRTGETRRVVIPVNNQPGSSFGSLGVGASPLAAGSARASSAEQALGALGTLPGSGLASGLLKPGPLEIPLGR